MPLVTISLSKFWSTEDQKLIADGIHEAIVGVGFPQTDRFQKILSSFARQYDQAPSTASWSSGQACGWASKQTDTLTAKRKRI